MDSQVHFCQICAVDSLPVPLVNEKLNTWIPLAPVLCISFRMCFYLPLSGRYASVWWFLFHFQTATSRFNYGVVSDDVYQEKQLYLGMGVWMHLELMPQANSSLARRYESSRSKLAFVVLPCRRI